MLAEPVVRLCAASSGIWREETDSRASSRIGRIARNFRTEGEEKEPSFSDREAGSITRELAS